MRMSVLVVLLLAPLAFSREITHEIGWEEGLRYSRHFGPFSVGARVTPRFSYSEGGADPSPSANPAYRYVSVKGMADLCLVGMKAPGANLSRPGISAPSAIPTS